MNLAASICPDNFAVKEGPFVSLTNGCPTALVIDRQVFASNIRSWPIAAPNQGQLGVDSSKI
jgi:hypothetical protein